MVKSNFKLFLILAFVSFVASTCDFSSGFCSAAGLSCPSQGSLTINGFTYYLADIDVISFGDLTLNHGDIQYRVAVRNNFYANNGVSVGDKITDNCGYALIVGGNIIWSQDGAVFPLNQTFFVGGNFSGPAYLNSQITSCSTYQQSAGCIASYFDPLLNYWSGFSSMLSTVNDNVDATFNQGTATLTCNSSSAGTYYVHISAANFNQTTGYSLSGCSTSANWVINLFGDVTFSGASLQAAGSIVYNIGGTGQITVATSVYGSIVAPSANLNMVGGTIFGKVIAGNISNVVQINPPTTCPGGFSNPTTNTCSSPDSSSSSGEYGASSSSSTSSASGSNSGSGTGTASGTSGVDSGSSSSSGSNNGSNLNGQQQSTSGAAMLVSSAIVTMIAAAFI